FASCPFRSCFADFFFHFHRSSMYDVIGNIHGYADALKRLLTKMGYRRCDGVWQHPERKVVFLGDFIDRGPQQVETLEIALDMVENGTALAVMGNHEFNAVAFATPHPDKPGEYLRPHTEKNLRQHEAFLAQIGKDESLYRRVISRFKALPLYLDLD